MRWSKDKLEWLNKSKEIYCDREDILNAFNEHYNTNVSLALLTKNNNRYKLGLPKAERIITRGLEIGWVKKRGFSRRNVNYVQEYRNGNRTFIKVDNAKTKDCFVPKNRYLYEQYYNVKLDPIKDIIIFLDNDYTNFNKENLYKMKRSVHALMVNQKLYNYKNASKISIIKFCEWKEKLIKLKEEK